jgi:copper chaperone
MEVLKFKTNIKCSGCVAKVTNNMNETAGEGNWEVDLNSPAKTLTIKGEGNVAKIKEAIEKAGFKAEAI